MKGRKNGETINMFNWGKSKFQHCVQLKETEQRSLGKLCIVAQRGFRPSIIHPELVRRLVADVVASHVSRVAEVKTALVGAFVGTVLQRDDCITGTQLFLSELAGVLLSLLGSDGRFAELASLLPTRKRITIRWRFIGC